MEITEELKLEMINQARCISSGSDIFPCGKLKSLEESFTYEAFTDKHLVLFWYDLILSGSDRTTHVVHKYITAN